MLYTKDFTMRHYYANSSLILQYLTWPINFVLYVLLEGIDLMLLKLASYIGAHRRLWEAQKTT